VLVCALKDYDEAVKLDPKNARIYGNEPGQNIHLPFSKKKQWLPQMVGLSCECLVLLCANFDS